MSALRPLRREASATLPARCDGSDQDTVTDLVARHPFAKLFDYPNRFMPDDQAGFDRILAPDDMQIFIIVRSYHVNSPCGYREILISRANKVQQAYRSRR